MVDRAGSEMWGDVTRLLVRDIFLCVAEACTVGGVETLVPFTTEESRWTRIQLVGIAPIIY